MSTPGNLAFDLPFPLSHDYAVRNANTAAPVILPDPMDTNPSICRFDMLDTVNLMELDHSLPSGQDTDDFFQPVGGNLTTLGLPLSSTLDALCQLGFINTLSRNDFEPSNFSLLGSKDQLCPCLNWDDSCQV